MKIKNNRKGFTLAEMLMTVAIILILAGVSFVGVIHYLKYLKQLENDGIAKEIFIAAQNHLSMASSQGFLGRVETVDSGTKPFGNQRDDEKNKGIYYFVIGGSGSTNPNDTDYVLNQMLPFASIDETVRLGGSYIIRYQKNPAIIKDVFYVSRTGRFNYTFALSDYDSLFFGDNPYTGEANKGRRRDYNGAVIGYYGGAATDIEPEITIKLPSIEVVNADRLIVKVTNPLDNIEDKDKNKIITENGLQLKLIITGVTSNNSRAITLINSSGNISDKIKGIYGSASKDFDKYTLVLDDITNSGTHFAELFGKDTSVSNLDMEGTGALIPGEDIEIKAIAFSNKKFANIAESAVSVTNSIFADNTTVVNNSPSTSIAVISNIRHLENLSNEISGLDYTSLAQVSFSKAQQTSDLSWQEFQSNIVDNPVESNSSTSEPVSASKKISIYKNNDKTGTTAGNFLPVNPKNTIDYQGQGKKITGIVVDTADNAGLFGSLKSEGSKISDLELINFSVASTGADKMTGALIGEADKVTIKNVLAHNDINADGLKEINATNDSSLSVSGKGSTGGLVGSMTGGSIDASAAAVYVKSEGGAAGGLVGSANGGTITNSYSGGHTDGKTGVYTTKDSGKGRINVIAGSGTAGGLVGTVSNGTISYCYSTCSVSGTTEGGFAGSVTSSSISNSYATGLVKWSKPSNESGSTSDGSSTSSLDTIGAFIGTGSAGYNTNHYFDLMNDGLKAVAGKDSEQVTAIDNSLADYQEFFGSGGTAVAYPYDNRLMLENRGKYYYPSIEQLYETPSASGLSDTDFVKSHYGDWCSPETKVINTSNPASGGTGE